MLHQIKLTILTLKDQYELTVCKKFLKIYWLSDNLTDNRNVMSRIYKRYFRAQMKSI